MTQAATVDATEPGASPIKHAGADTFHREIDGWKYYRCSASGMLYLNPRPTPEAMQALYQSPEYYENSEFGRGYQSYATDAPLYEATYARRMGRVRRQLEPGAPVLDVGCGYGYALSAATALGFEAWGVDFESASLERCRGLVGERATPLERANEVLPRGRFALITLFDVFEHLYDPHAALRQYADWLRPGGFLMMTTPDCDSWLARFSGRRWVSYKTPEHIFIYNPRAVTALCEPLFATERIWSETQHVAWPFLAQRLSATWPLAAPLARAGAALGGVFSSGVSVTSGSLTYLGRKRDTPAEKQSA